jgi:hypothetical protein
LSVDCEQHLALKAILIGLRRSGAIDRHAVKTIVATLQETAAKARPNCAESADGLLRLADALAEGPAKTCTIDIAA